MQYDKDFLVQLDRQRNKTIYARVTKLTFEELPLDRIEGIVTGGSINIDGNSALRRTCSLTILAQGTQQIDFYCGLNTKFKLEIGVKNTIDTTTYPEVVWFNQGIYIITSFNNSHSASSYTISVSGKDKMCLLNGEVGGSLESSVDFGQIEEEDIYGNWSIRKLPLKEIIRNAVHVYGKEPFHNIIINDLEDFGLELLEYRYDTPLYLYRKIKTPTYVNATFDGNTKCHIKGASTATPLSDLTDSVLENLTSLVEDDNKWVQFDGDSEKYYITKISYGEACGYSLTDLTYAGDLVANAGESLTSVLDKIKNMLVNFEYFYNTDGQFIFQKKPSVISVMQTLDPTKESKANASLIFTDNIYTFNGGEAISTINNNPNLLNLKNDYSIWGERESTSGAKIPIHLRYAIDVKPIKYTTISVAANEVEEYNRKYSLEIEGQISKTYEAGNSWTKTGSIQYCDWREVLYRMACDYYKYNFLDNFHVKVANVNPEFANGVTGYENYYTDIFSFWRQLYYPINEDLTILSNKKTTVGSLIKNSQDTTSIINAATTMEKIKNLKGLTARITALEEFIKSKRAIMKAQSSNKNGDVYKNAKKDLSEAEKYLGVVESQLQFLEDKQENIINKIDNLTLDQENYYTHNSSDEEKRCWNKQIFSQPYALNFWFDFLSTDGLLSYYNVKSIGNRQKVVKDNQVKVISYNEVPNIIYHRDISNIKDTNGQNLVQIEDQDGYKHIQAGAQYDNMFSISAQAKSAVERLHELMDIHSFCSETVTINAAPIYYLEPNSRVVVSDRDSDVSDVYMVNKITLPLAHNGTMSISATKIYDSLT